MKFRKMSRRGYLQEISTEGEGKEFPKGRPNSINIPGSEKLGNISLFMIFVPFLDFLQ